jgi:phosphatidylserine/phosphatidylglycerophosphate/cardiolipin synthase-like enzyme
MIDLPDGRILWFSPDDPAEQALLNFLGGAERSLDVMIHASTLVPAIDSLIAAHERSLAVRVVLDKSQAEPATPGTVAYAMSEEEAVLGGSPEPAQIARLRDAAVPLVIGNSSAGSIIHSKYAIVDGSRVLWGSLNWSLSAPQQCNVTTTETDPQVVAAFVADFEANWSRLGGSAIPG